MKDILFDPQMTTYDMAGLEDFVEQIKPVHALEIGSWKGLSSSIIARHTNVLFCVDMWTGSPVEPHMEQEAKTADVMAVFINNMAALGVLNKIRVMRMLSIEAANVVRPGLLDFIYIDGDHQYDNVKLDIALWFEILKPGGFMMGHDYDAGHPDVVKAVDELIPNACKIPKTSLWVTKKELK